VRATDKRTGRTVRVDRAARPYGAAASQESLAVAIAGAAAMAIGPATIVGLAIVTIGQFARVVVGL